MGAGAYGVAFTFRLRAIALEVIDTDANIGISIEYCRLKEGIKR